jgi:tetratricopeptide (TPR) repeat protein
MGEFRDAVGCRKEVLQFDKPKKTDHNNLALVALKAGDYLTAIKEVNELDSTDPDGAEARVWSARAYAYQGLYTEAEGELAIACRNRIEDACVRLRGVRESGVPKSWWRVDRTERERLWSSTTRIPDSCGLLRNELDGWSISHFAGSSWFNELTQFYS